MSTKKRLVCLYVLFLIGVTSRWAFGQDAIPLDQAARDGKVEVEISGIGGSTGDTILITVRRRVPEVLRLMLTPGTVFKSVTRTVQNMAGASIKGERLGERSYRPTTKIVLADDDKHSFVVEAYCLDFHKGNPGPSDRFSIAPPDRQTLKILQAGKAKDATIQVIQAAVWIDRDGATAAQLKQRFPVDDGDIEAARDLLQDAKQAKLGTPSTSATPATPRISPPLNAPKVPNFTPPLNAPPNVSTIPSIPRPADVPKVRPLSQPGAAQKRKSSEPDFRTWTDSTGKYTVEAEFVDFQDGKVRLRKGNGSIVALPIERLSAADQQFVKAQGEAKAEDNAANETPTVRWPKGVRTDPVFAQTQPMKRIGYLVIRPGVSPDYENKQPVTSASQWLDRTWDAPSEKQDQSAVEAIEKAVASALESCGFSSSRVVIAKGDMPRDVFTRATGMDGLLLIRFQTMSFSVFEPSGELGRRGVWVIADAGLFRPADLKPLMVSGLQAISVIGAELGDGTRTVTTLDYAGACASAVCRELDRAILCSLQCSWQESDIERGLAVLREHTKEAMPKPTESRFNNEKAALLEVNVEGVGKTATLMLGGNWPRRWTASTGRVVHVILKPGTYPIALEERTGSESRQYAGQLAVSGGKAYLYSIK